MKVWRTFLAAGVRVGLIAIPLVLLAADSSETPTLPPSPPELPVQVNRQVRPTATAGTPVPRRVMPTQVLVGTNRSSSQYFNGTAPGGLPVLRPPALLSRPPEYPYAVPSPDPTYVPGLMMSSPAYAGTAARQMVPVRTGVPASVTPGGLGVPARPFSPPKQETVLAWDGLVKEVSLKPGEASALFRFAFTNTSPQEVVLTAVRTSCGCTVAKMPRMPWPIAPGTNAAFDVTVDVRGKSGTVTKTVTVDTSAGYRYLTVRVSIPMVGGGGLMASSDRARNLQVALADRQSVLKGDCAVCHVTPGVGKKGEDLYVAVCGVCHEAEHRASMVPVLRALNKPMQTDDWRRVITQGKPDSLMPAFAADHGGPLTTDQIESLVAYLTGPFKTRPAVAHRVATQPPLSARPATE